MQATDDRHMQKATEWGTGEITGAANRREQSPPAPHVEGLYTGSLEVNGQLVPTARGYFFVDIPRGPIMKWIPASPPQAAPGFSVHTDPATLDPRVPYSDVSMHTHHDPWMALRQHVWLIFGAIILGAILLQWGNTQRDPFSKAERKLVQEVEK